MARRVAGEGTRGRRKDGVYYGAVTMTSGKREYVYDHTTEGRDRKVKALIEQRDRGTASGNRRQTVGEYLEEWLPQVKERVRPTTYASYELYALKHIRPVLGKVKLQELGPRDVQGMISKISSEGKVAPGTIRHIRAVLRVALSDAVAMEIITRNVAKPVTLPRDDTDRRVRPLTPEQTRTLIAGALLEPMGTLYVVKLGLGLRLGEVLGLQWGDVRDGVAHIERQVQRIEHQLVLVPLKTARSRRQIAVPRFVVDALEVRRAEHDSGVLVFCRAEGGLLDGTLINHQFHRLLTKLGLPQQRPHDLRHLAASLAISQGAPLKEVSEMLGHSQIAITADLYGHLYDEARRGIAAKMDLAVS